jgi:hypothetical protein
MKYTEQDLKDEYEQAVKRKGKLYAEGYVEGLKDAQTQALTIQIVVGQSEQLVSLLKKLKEENMCSVVGDELIEQLLKEINCA